MSVSFVMHHYIHHIAAQIYNGSQFIFHLLIGMLHLEYAACSRWPILYDIAPIGADNIISGGANQRHVLHNHLAAYIAQLSQCFARHRAFTVFYVIDDKFSSFSSCHQERIPPFLHECFLDGM